MLKKISRYFLSKSKVDVKIDLHSHLLVDIDDGCRTIEESIAIVKRMKKLGYKKLIVTPHIMSHRYPNNIKIIRNSLFALRGMLKVKNIDIEIEAAAEYYFDTHFFELIKRNELLSFGKNYILFEFSYKDRPENIEEVIQYLISKKYVPVLAHSERYLFLKDIIEYRKLKNMGILFQINVNSISGFYGKEAQKKSWMLVEKGMVDFTGSDIHHEKHMKNFEETIFLEKMDVLYVKNKILNKYL